MNFSPHHIKSLKTILDRLCVEQADEEVHSDPLGMVFHYTDPGDLEAAAFTVAGLSLGRSGQIRKAAYDFLNRAGPSPFRFFYEFEPERDRSRLHGFRYRFYGEEEMLLFSWWMHQVLHRWGTLEALFLEGYDSEDPHTGPSLSRFVKRVLSLETRPVLARPLKKGRGLRHFLADPEDGSGCKRLNLFLRWMVRRKKPDLGLWNNVNPAKLICPLDTHVARLSRCLGITDRKSMDWRMAEQITGFLRMLDPADPVRYDFALCHAGMNHPCPQQPGSDPCMECPLKDFCVRLENGRGKGSVGAGNGCSERRYRQVRCGI